MQFIDTHCHLDLLENIDTVIGDAKTHGVSRIVAPATCERSANKLLKIAQKHTGVVVAVGIHPEEVGNTAHIQSVSVKKIEEFLSQKNKKVVAIGECGLDFKDTTETKKRAQITLLKQHIDWSLTFRLPLIIHNRKAGDELLTILKKAKLPREKRGVFHCFTGSKKFVKEVVEQGFLIGVGGLVTLDQGLQEVIKTVPLTKIVLETDSPYLTPKPVKEKTPWPNTPANIPYIASQLAELKEVSVAEIAKRTSANAQELFGL